MLEIATTILAAIVALPVMERYSRLAIRRLRKWWTTRIE
jgi:hypothetical protein